MKEEEEEEEEEEEYDDDDTKEYKGNTDSKVRPHPPLPSVEAGRKKWVKNTMQYETLTWNF